MSHWCDFCQTEHSSMSCYHPGRHQTVGTIKDMKLVLTSDEARKIKQHLDGEHPYVFTDVHFVINGVSIRKDLEITFE